MSIDIRDRLSDLSIEVSEETTSMHLSAVAAELRSPSPIPPRRYRRRPLPIVVLTALVVVALTAAGAVAAESAVSGDRLYPVKQTTEWMRSWVDPTVPADHRIDELEELVNRRAAHEAIADQLQRAADAVADVSVGDPVTDAPLVDRLETVRDRVPSPVVEPEADIVTNPPPDAPKTGPGDGEAPPPGPDRDARRPEDGRTGPDDEARRERGEELAVLCRKVAASENRREEFPSWVLRRCRYLAPAPGDSADSP